MRGLHPAGCTCDQMWHHRPPFTEVRATRRTERERMNDARRIGKATAHNERRHGAPLAESPAAPAVPP